MQVCWLAMPEVVTTVGVFLPLILGTMLPANVALHTLMVQILKPAKSIREYREFRKHILQICKISLYLY